MNRKKKRILLPSPTRLKFGRKTRLQLLMATRILRLFPFTVTHRITCT